MKKLQVTVGIPAYNEEANIKNLVTNLLAQKGDTFVLKEIIVVSDASTDGTEKEIKSVKNSLVTFIQHKKRQGQAVSQNKILEMFTGDVLVLLNADVIPSKNTFLNNLIAPFLKEANIGVVSGKVTPLPASNYFEKVINYSVSMKVALYEKFNKKDNIYLCHGRVRAFSKAFAKKFIWKPVVSEDSYSYLACITKRFKFIYATNAEVLYSSPNNLTDHIGQSARFLNSKEDLKKHFANEIVDKAYAIPLNLQLATALRWFVKSPVLFLSYLSILVYAKFISWKFFSNKILWKTSDSSKRLILRQQKNA